MADQSDETQRGAGAGFAAEIERDKNHRDKARNLKPLRRLMPFVGRYPGVIALFFVFLVLAAGLTLTLPAVGRVLLDCGFGSGEEFPQFCERFALGDPSNLDSYFKLAMVLGAAMAIASALRFYFVSLLGQRVITDIRRAVYDHLTTLSPQFYEKVRTGEVLSRLTTDTTLIETVIGSSVSFAVRSIATTVGAIIIMLFVSWKLTLMILFSAPLIILPAIFFGRRVQRLSRDGQDNLANASARAGESLGAIQTVQAFTRESFERARFAESAENTFTSNKRRLRVRALMTAFIFGMGLIALTGILWFGAEAVGNGSITAGQILQFAMLAFLAVSGAGFLTEVWTEFLRAAGATERIMEILEARPDITAPVTPAYPAKNTSNLAFESVSFAYPSRPETPVLTDVSFAVSKGETVALVGPSGAGKSTLFQLLLRFYDVSTGRITIGDVAVTDMEPQALRRLFAIVQQNTPLFSGSAMDNIRYGRTGASDDDVIAAAKAAYAHDFIMKLPEGYQTDLGERAATLSGGQRQRIAIARAILRDAPILLLDEATSALDAESEQVVQKAFEELSKGKTTLVIAHRLATVRDADRIIVMDNGRIVNQGTHDELLAKDGVYARLAALQFSG